MTLENKTRDAHHFAAWIGAQADNQEGNTDVGKGSELGCAVTEQPHQQDRCIDEERSEDGIDGWNKLVDEYIRDDIENGKSQDNQYCRGDNPRCDEEVVGDNEQEKYAEKESQYATDRFRSFTDRY